MRGPIAAVVAVCGLARGQGIRFEDAAIPFTLDDGAGAGKRRLIETMVGGAAAFDFDNDGRPDLYFAGGGLFRNAGEGKFRAHPGLRGAAFEMGAAAADYDNDGHTDLFVAGVQGNKLYRNRGGGVFEDVTARAGLREDRPRWSVGAAWLDYNNDGWLDLFVVRYVAWEEPAERTCTIGKARTYCHPRHYAAQPNALYRSNGDGTFTDVSASSGIGAHAGKGMSAAVGDFDGDGRMDIFVANDTVPNFLFRNEGDGRFREAGAISAVGFNDDGRAVSSMGADARDYDNDGREDLFVTANNNETFPLFRNLGRGAFSDVTYPSGVGRASMTLTGWSNGIFDFDNDGRKDLFAACGAIDANVEEYSSRKSRHPNLVLRNEGGRFAAVSGAGLDRTGRHRGAAFADFDGDGRVDVAVTRIGEAASLYRNVTPGGNWLRVRLRGRRSNRDGIGALIRVTGARSGRQWNRVTTAVGYASSSDKVAHFGMGTDTEAAEIEVSWPSGAKQKLERVACGRIVEIEEESVR